MQRLIAPSLLFIAALALASSLVSALLPSASTAAASARGFPNLDINSACRDVAKLELNRASNYSACVSDENAARAQLEKEWASYPADMREQCMGMATPPALPSYLALQACLSTAKDAERLAKSGLNQQLPGTPGIR